MEKNKSCSNCQFGRCTEEVGYYCVLQNRTWFKDDDYYEPTTCEEFVIKSPEEPVKTGKIVAKVLAAISVVILLLFIL